MINEIYLEIVEGARFTNYSGLRLRCAELEERIRGVFSDMPLLETKRIGSSMTGTMRTNSRDLDYFIGFAFNPSIGEIKARLENSGLNILRISHDERYGYSRFSGIWKDYEFVLVPIKKPKGEISTYPEDAYHHPDFINERKETDHTENVILAKEFFSRIGIYKQIKGISCELMILELKSFDELLRHILENEFIRVNFSPFNESYSESRIVIDYPYLGRRSLTEYISPDGYKAIQEFANGVLDNPNKLRH